ncbi:hypothetical protein QJS10_CPA05g01322 [Acorus calamus]|uniref:Uncharacterized protein n=1 Tax=Acorus calamus TaxID=4465 RepID=A0AAV9CQI4_ACOCL|nr:hypothetical protein QJS10_CPB17g02356 [Acorus calamus]KAK1316278.1 hypothetical protein QJS10_CPA05g01322 [Acorus calamus]
MVLHVLVMGKMPIFHAFKLAALLWPLNLWFPLARQLPRVANAVSSTVSLFAFRLRRISSSVDDDDGPPRRSPSRSDRWERALRMLFQEVVPVGDGRRRRQRRRESVGEWIHRPETDLEANSLQALLSISM